MFDTLNEYCNIDWDEEGCRITHWSNDSASSVYFSCINKREENRDEYNEIVLD